VANVPIINNMELPETVLEFRPDRVFCLTTEPRTLALLRRSRQNHLRGATGDYATINYVKDELKYAQNIFNKNPKWTKIEVTNKPIEEIASEILLIVKQQNPSNG